MTEPIRRLSFSPAAASAEPTPSKPTPKRSALSKERLGLLSMDKALRGISEETGQMIKVTPIKAAKAPRREVSSSEENSDESDSDSAGESKPSKSSKKKEKKKEKMFTEPMGVSVEDMDKPLTQDASAAISMLERKMRETRTEAGVYFQQNMMQLRLKAVRAKAVATKMRTFEGSQEELNLMVGTNYTMIKELADELYKSYCLMDSFYGDCGENFGLFESFLFNCHRHSKVLQKSQFTEKMMTKTAKEHGLAFSRTQGYSTPRAARANNRRLKGPAKRKAQSRPDTPQPGMANVQCHSCKQYGHKAYQAACPNYANFKSKKARAAGQG